MDDYLPKTRVSRANFNSHEVAKAFISKIPEDVGAQLFPFFSPSGRQCWVVFWLK